MRTMIAILGIMMLLLPGTCALILTGGSLDSSLIGVWVICFLISAAGLVLLYAAIWGQWNGHTTDR